MSRCLSGSEEAEIDRPEPQGILTRAHELEISCRTSQEQNPELQSEARALESESKCVSAKETCLTDEHNKLQYCNKELEGRTVADARDEKPGLQQMKKLREEEAQCSSLLLKEKSVRDKSGPYMRTLEEESKNMTAEQALIKSPKVKEATEIEYLKAAVNYLWEKQNHFSDNITDEQEHRTEAKHAEVEKLRTALHALQVNEKILNEQNANLTAELAHLECLNKTNQAEIKQQRAAVLDLQCQISEAREVNRDKDEAIQKLTHVESLMERKQAEIERLSTALHEAQEKEDFLSQQIEIITDELVRVTSLTEKHKEEKKILKTAVKNLQYQLEVAEQLIWHNDELILKQNSELAYKQSVIDEMFVLNAEMKRSALDLEDQLETTQAEEILAGVENVGEESRKAENTEHVDSPEQQRAESVPETPAAESQTRPLWRYATGLGIAAVGVGLIAWAFLRTR